MNASPEMSVSTSTVSSVVPEMSDPDSGRQSEIPGTENVLTMDDIATELSQGHMDRASEHIDRAVEDAGVQKVEDLARTREGMIGVADDSSTPLDEAGRTRLRQNYAEQRAQEAMDLKREELTSAAEGDAEFIYPLRTRAQIEEDLDAEVADELSKGGEMSDLALASRTNDRERIDQEVSARARRERAEFVREHKPEVVQILKDKGVWEEAPEQIVPAKESAIRYKLEQERDNWLASVDEAKRKDQSGDELSKKDRRALEWSDKLEAVVDKRYVENEGVDFPGRKERIEQRLGEIFAERGDEVGDKEARASMQRQAQSEVVKAYLREQVVNETMEREVQTRLQAVQERDVEIRLVEMRNDSLLQNLIADGEIPVPAPAPEVPEGDEFVAEAAKGEETIEEWRAYVLPLVKDGGEEPRRIVAALEAKLGYAPGTLWDQELPEISTEMDTIPEDMRVVVHEPTTVMVRPEVAVTERPEVTVPDEKVVDGEWVIEHHPLLLTSGEQPGEAETVIHLGPGETPAGEPTGDDLARMEAVNTNPEGVSEVDTTAEVEEIGLLARAERALRYILGREGERLGVGERRARWGKRATRAAFVVGGAALAGVTGAPLGAGLLVAGAAHGITRFVSTIRGRQRRANEGFFRAVGGEIGDRLVGIRAMGASIMREVRAPDYLGKRPGLNRLLLEGVGTFGGVPLGVVAAKINNWPPFRGGARIVAAALGVTEAAASVQIATAVPRLMLGVADLFYGKEEDAKAKIRANELADKQEYVDGMLLRGICHRMITTATIAAIAAEVMENGRNMIEEDPKEEPKKVVEVTPEESKSPEYQYDNSGYQHWEDILKEQMEEGVATPEVSDLDSAWEDLIKDTRFELKQGEYPWMKIDLEEGHNDWSFFNEGLGVEVTQTDAVRNAIADCLKEVVDVTKLPVGTVIDLNNLPDAAKQAIINYAEAATDAQSSWQMRAALTAELKEIMQNATVEAIAKM